MPMLNEIEDKLAVAQANLASINARIESLAKVKEAVEKAAAEVRVLPVAGSSTDASTG